MTSDIVLAKTLLAIARETVSHGKRLEPHMLEELSAIANNQSLPHYMQRDATRIVAMETGEAP